MLVSLILRTMGVMFVLVALHLNNNAREKTLKHKIFSLLSWLYLMDCFFLLPVWFLLGNDYFYLDRDVPFSQTYGPLVYFLFLASKGDKISRKKWIIHSIPVVIIWIAYLIYVNSELVRAYTSIYFSPALYICIGISMMGYAIAITYDTHNPRSVKARPHIALFSWYCLIAGVSMLFSAYQIFMDGLNGAELSQGEMNAAIVALFMLGGAIVLFGEALSEFRQQFAPKLAPRPVMVRSNPYMENSKSPFNISNISHAKTRQKIDQFFESEYITNPDLNIKKASELLEMPQKDLKESLQNYYKMSFVKMLTAKRVELACRLLVKEQDEDYNSLSDRCGFSSRATFYRNFQRLKGCSPTQYKLQK